MTDLNQIDAAIEERPHTWFNHDQGEREGRTEEITQWFFDHEQTILEALRVYKALLGEPSDAVIEAGADAGVLKGAEFKVIEIFKAMSAELIKQVKENKE